ncbi:hypothetical protein QUB17_05200 [Microcoleus sp. B5-C4]
MPVAQADLFFVQQASCLFLIFELQAGCLFHKKIDGLWNRHLACS